MSTSDGLSIGQRIREEREARSWSQKMLAEKIIAVTEKEHAISEQGIIRHISRWEKGENVPSPFYREKLCKIFDITPEELGFVRQAPKSQPALSPTYVTPTYQTIQSTSLITHENDKEEQRSDFSKVLHDEPSFIWNVPYLRNLYFTGREEILTRLHDKFSTKKTIALTQPHAISGLGGIGKTQIALEYAYRYGHEYKVVLWVQADSKESLNSEFAKLASLLDLPEKEQIDQNIVVAAVRRWLQNNTDWLLILDNADDIIMALEFLPTGAPGHMLLTTRSQPKGNNIIGIEVEKMGREEGVLFVLRRAKIIAEDAPIESVSDAQIKDADTLYDLLDGLPLALDQTGAYMEENHVIVQDYLHIYETQYWKLLQKRSKFSEKEYPNSVATTWSLNFERVEQNNPAAAELLYLCAFLHPDAIPEDMIMSGAAELGSILQDTVVDRIRLYEAIGELLNYSLIRRNAKTKTITIHRLVQVVLKESMNEQTRREWAERTVRAISLVFPNVVEVNLWEQCQRYLPHALICATLVKDYNFEVTEASNLLNETANYLYYHDQQSEAEQLYQSILAICEQQLGADHLDTGTTLNNLALLYYGQRRYAEAEPLCQRALAIFEQQLGVSHPYVAMSLNFLAQIYEKLGKYHQ